MQRATVYVRGISSAPLPYSPPREKEIHTSLQDKPVPCPLFSCLLYSPSPSLVFHLRTSSVFSPPLCHSFCNSVFLLHFILTPWSKSTKFMSSTSFQSFQIIFPSILGHFHSFCLLWDEIFGIPPVFYWSFPLLVFCFDSLFIHSVDIWVH